MLPPRPEHVGNQANGRERTMGQPNIAGQSIYEVHLRGHLDKGWSASFPGLEMEHVVDPKGTPLTILRGPIADEAGLHGILTRIRDLGIPLLLVEKTVDDRSTDDTATSDAAADDRSVAP
jgi:hypothetical protein